ncbi:hypothetical protein IAD21_00549 [Abditibacteriota bacterium]|nr:hypothetical protein IAD21_00549 [Abditibacteriota bacterium]
MLTFGSLLRQARESVGASRHDLAVRVRLSETYLTALETGRSAPPSAPAIVDLARAVRVNPDDLFALSGKMAPDIERALCESPQLVQGLRVLMGYSAPELIEFVTAHGVAPSTLAGVVSSKNDERRVVREVVTADLKQAVFHLDGHTCVYCSSTTLLEVDHIQAVSFGGTNDVDNLVTCCSRCNKLKGNGKQFVRVFGRFEKEVI